MAIIIDGKALAAKRQLELADKVSQLKKEQGIVPGLVVILVGDDPASHVYVRNKERSAIAAGFNSKVLRLPEQTSEEELLELIESYNQNPDFHGILVQLPLPSHIDEEKILLAISPDKDVDGFHPYNMGRLWTGKPNMLPCTPAGVMTMLREYQIPLEGRKAVVVGCSNIVGKPMAQMLLAENCTVTIAHSKTQNLAYETKQADILVIAIGDGHFITEEHVKECAVVIDVGINYDKNGKIIGDVKYDDVINVASHITPVPGGVGPMTITTLMEQTYTAAVNSLDKG